MSDMILVTGGAGFIGSHLTRRLLARGYRVRVLDSFLYGKQGLEDVDGDGALEVVDGDVADEATVIRAAHGARGVIALAALVGDAACDVDPDHTMRVNYQSTRHVLAACHKAGVQRLVFASSCSVYGANGSGVLREDSALNPVSLYARTRIMSEELLLGRPSKVEVVVLRLATVCGISPRMRFDLLVNTMTASAVVQGQVRVTGAEQWRPNLHVRDAAEAFVLAMESPLARGQIFNVGSDQQNFTIGEVAERVAERVAGTEVQYSNGSGDLRSYRVSFEKISQLLGFQCQRGIDDAIDEVRGVLESGAISDFAHERFHNSKWLRATRASSAA